MKTALLSLTISLISLASIAQTEDSTTTETSENIQEASYHFGNAGNKTANTFKINREPVVLRRAFKVNTATTQDEVYERALGFARMMNANYNSDKKAGTITIPVSWQYQGNFNDCVENLSLNAVLLIEVKDVKTRISLTDIVYEHTGKEEKGAKPVAKSDFFSTHAACAPEKGKVELLYNCKECTRSINSIDKNFRSQFDVYANQYQERLKKY
ncbi:MAG TPA: hypothetical protein PL009_08970 [Flavipsychrobacter sp.]|nr:hypothetical protein [Flavipsychrobacter sp.]